MGFSFRLLYQWFVDNNYLDKEILEDDFLQSGVNGFTSSLFVKLYDRILQLEKKLSEKENESKISLLQKEIRFLVEEARKELSIKDKRIAFLETEVTRMFEPTRKFWDQGNEETILKLKNCLIDVSFCLEPISNFMLSRLVSSRAKEQIRKIKECLKELESDKD